MKKILVFFISIFLYCATPSFVKAESGVITENEVADLLNSAWKLFETVSQNAEGYIDKSGDPISLERDGRMVAYLPAKSEYAEYTYWEELAKKIYTEDIYKYAIEQGAGSGYTLGLLTEHQGKAYFLKNDSLEVLTEGGS